MEKKEVKKILIDWNVYAPSQYQRRIYFIFWYPFLKKKSENSKPGNIPK